MPRLLHEARNEVCEAWSRSFDYVDSPGSGFSFPCDKDGNLLPELTDTARENYRRCVSGEVAVVDKGIIYQKWSYRQDSVYQCDCGGEMHFTKYCGVHVCDSCHDHLGLARCYCGWSANGGNGYAELVEMGETIEDDY